VERHVKERLVGAAVLMAAAIILIPEMLSGPEREATPAATAPGRDAALKTYTIDLQDPQGSAAPGAVDERAPPAETPSGGVVESRPESQANPQASVSDTSTASAPASREEPVQAQPPPPSGASSRETPAAMSPPPRAESSMPAVSAPKASRTGAWAVQIGSFSRQTSADRLAGELRAAGHTAFVMPIQSGASTLYRVRVGPMHDRASAAAALGDLKPKFPGAAVVGHP
jgi:DedD protein